MIGRQQRGPSPLGLKVVVVAGLSDYKLQSKLAPLLALEYVGQVTLVRRKPLYVSGVQNHCPPRWMASLLPLAELYRVLALLWMCIGPSRPDLLIGIFMIPHGVYAGWTGRIFKIPVIQLLIGSDRQPTLARGWLRSHLHMATLIGVRGDKTGLELQAAGIPDEKIFVPPNVFDVDLWAPAYGDKPLYDMVYVGSLLPVKRPQFLLEVLVALKHEFPSIRLAYIGSGPLDNALKGEVGKLGLQNNVVFLGEMAPQEVAYHLSRSRLFTMAYSAEGLPMSLIEAMSCGVPPVITNVNDIPNVATHGKNAWIVEPPTVENFAEAVRCLLTDTSAYERLRQGAFRARDEFRRSYSLESATQTWYKALLREVPNLVPQSETPRT